MATAELTTPPTAAPRREPFPRPWTPAEFDRMRELDLFAGRAVDLIDGQVIEHAPDGTGPRPFVFTRKEYYALYDNHFFFNQRVQLIGGVIVQESPMNPPHAASIAKASKKLLSKPSRTTSSGRNSPSISV